MIFEKCSQVTVFDEFDLSPIRTNSGKYVHFFYLGPIRTNESQRARNVQKWPQMTLLSFLCKQTFFTSNVDQIITNPNKILLCPILTNGSQRAGNVQNWPQMTLLGLSWQKTFFSSKVDQIITDSNKILFGVKNYDFLEMPPDYPTWWVWCRKKTSKTTSAQYLRTVANMSTFFYLGPIHANESQRTRNVQNWPQITLLGLLIPQPNQL